MTSALNDLALVRRCFVIQGPRVRVNAGLTGEDAAQLQARGLVELSESAEAFEPGQAQRCLTVTQYGYDLALGRITP